MDQNRLSRLVGAIAAQPDGSLADRLCSAAMVGLDAEGVGLSMIVDDALLQSVSATDGARGFEELQAGLGEGPAYTAQRHGWPVLVEDLGCDDTWPAFGPAAAEVGLGSVFAFPLQRGAIRLGALTLYRRTTGAIRDEHHADALVFARFALDLLLAVQSGRPAYDLDQLFDGVDDAAEIHQATGIVSVQLGIAVGAALAVLRAHAYADGRPLRETAADVVAHRLRLEPDG
ncbi:GAF and ANTAR domain-containing protein [Nitriliruptor alkaliphilus]|uniref:GAF and ANTAR domain-containing protein n=1 Tax=Nitriliruptor alkaliphilus TaxID=427918 RepID=UPI0006991E02|nr:GAF and ANTAR domain-containing protein [Nitriliruptor alkaliphilus]